MALKFTRRQAVIGVSSALLLPAGCSTSTHHLGVISNDVFRHGVASGDPDASSVVLWTRVSGATAPVSVQWQVASDPEFAQVRAQGSATTDASRDYTVKIIAGSLPPGETFYYQFVANQVASPLGRNKTLPDAGLDELVIAVASCSNYPFGYFNGYDAIANDPDVDIVVHLGDYIYEYDEDGYGSAQGKALGRIHEPRHEIVTLADYRTRHAQYKADAGSMAMHAHHPLIATWDDHETTNNPWVGGAQNHQPEEGDWLSRRNAALKAYFEWMPVRDPGPGGAPEKLWRHYKFGDLASLITLESRLTARSKQIDIGDYDEQLTSVADAQHFYAQVVGDPARRLLSTEMEDYLRVELRESVQAGRRWRLIANQVIMSKVVTPSFADPVFDEIRAELSEYSVELLDMLTRFGELELAGNMDAWDGYPAARERFYQIAKDAGARDLLVLTGDTHTFWENTLADAGGLSMGVELGTSGITSPRGFHQFGSKATARLDELVAQRNESVAWVDGSNRGYIRLTLTKDRAHADFIAVSSIETPDYTLHTMRTTDIANIDGLLRYE